MASRKGLVLNSGKPEQIQDEDVLTGGYWELDGEGDLMPRDLGVGIFELDANSDLQLRTVLTSAGLFEVDGSGDAMPITGSASDDFFELDGNSDAQPKAA